MQPFFAAIDWGTSNFRLWLVDADGNILARKKTAEGMSTLSSGDYADVLEAHLAELQAPPGLPVVICGMAGSRTGWTEAPYLDTPVPVERLSANAVQPHSLARPVWILSGVCQRDHLAPDVMRGEETQLAGARILGAGDGLFCLPGTHSKWVEVSNGQITRFHTFMTGEMYALLSRHSVLANLREHGDDAWNDREFGEAVATMLENPNRLTRELFAIRAGVLLDCNGYHNPGSRLSGLLMGTEIASIRQTFAGAQAVNLISEGIVGQHYQSALDQAGLEVARFDSEAATVGGLTVAAHRLIGDRRVVRTA